MSILNDDRNFGTDEERREWNKRVAIPSAYKGMTNGEVMDKLFPEISERLYDDVFTED